MECLNDVFTNFRQKYGRRFAPTPIRLQNAISISGGSGEIRTLEALSGLPPFQGGALDHYATLPGRNHYGLAVISPLTA